MATNDGRPSENGLKLSQFDSQPANFWFRSSNQYADFQPQEEINSAQLSQDITSQADLQDRDGGGTVIAVLDTGIYKDHAAFSAKDKVLECNNFCPKGNSETLEEWENCQDYNGHGTRCAGLACGLPFKGLEEEVKEYSFKSSAPGARLMVCKVGESKKEGASKEAIISALNHIITHNETCENTEKVDVVSLSFGFDHFNEDFAMKVQEVISKRIIVVCCASNGGCRSANPITYPSRLGNVLCIGACDKDSGAVAFSSRGREIDFVELGKDVWAPTIGYYSAIEAVDGTSYSTPSVAGLICRLLKDLKRLSPEIHEKMHNVWCIKELLMTMSVRRGHHENATGYGRLEPGDHFKKGDAERLRICREILGMETQKEETQKEETQKEETQKEETQKEETQKEETQKEEMQKD